MTTDKLPAEGDKYILPTTDLADFRNIHKIHINSKESNKKYLLHKSEKGQIFYW